jgi:hypothetical protein
MTTTRLAAAAALLLTTACAPPPTPPAAANAPPADAATAKWAALAKLPDWSGVWEVDWRNSRGMPRKPPMKLTPEWQAKADAYKASQARGENLQSDAANCVPPGLPGIMTQPYPIEFLYQPDKIVMLTEAYMQFRHVWMDGRPHPEDPDLTFYGHSTGRWDGDTLVIDTIGLNPQNRIAPGITHSEQLHVVERIRRADKDWLEIETTLTDPEVLAEPYTSTTSYRHLDDELREYICLENNHDSADDQGRPGINLE